MAYKKGSTFSKVSPNADNKALAARLNSLMTQLEGEFTSIERTTFGGVLSTVVVGGNTGTASSTSPAWFVHNAKKVSLTIGENTVTFTEAFGAEPVVGVVSCVATVEGEIMNIRAVIDPANITTANFKVTVDADCTLSYFALEAH